MLDEVTADHFKPHVGATFSGRTGDLTTPLRLQAAEELPDNRTEKKRTCFQLLFKAPPGTRLDQQIFYLSGAEFQELPVFLVPIGADASGVEYQAVFT